MTYTILFSPANDQPIEAETTFESFGDAASCVMDYVTQRHEEYPEDCPSLDFRCWSFPDKDISLYTDAAGNVWTITYSHAPVDDNTKQA